MRHDDVSRAVVAALQGDAALTTALGGQHIYRSGAFRAPQVPSVEWFVVSETKRENTMRLLLQLDIWARSYAAAVTIEQRVRRLLDLDIPHPVAGLLMWVQVEDARDQPDPQPEIVHRVLTVSFEPTRESVP